MKRRRRRIEYPDELYHFGIKGMKWGVRKDRGSRGSSSKPYNRRKDVAKRLFTNDHIGAIKTGIRSRKAYNRKIKANMEYDDMYNKLLDDKINADPKMKKALDDYKRAAGKKFDSDKDYDNWLRVEERYHTVTDPAYREATRTANNHMKQKWGYDADKDFSDPQYRLAAERDMSRIRRKKKEKERIANDPELRRRRRRDRIKTAASLAGTAALFAGVHHFSK